MTLQRIAILITVYNRKDKTIKCLKSIERSINRHNTFVEVFLTDDGSTDGTQEALAKEEFSFPIHILKGDGKLFWNGGMINSWKAAIAHGKHDGYLWLNNDTIMLPCYWNNLKATNEYCLKNHKRTGIYVGSTYNPIDKVFSYGGFNFKNKWFLKDIFIIPNNQEPQPCQCAHGNITFISKEVVDQMGIFYNGYIHGASDHDYTYRAFKKGIPILVMPDYVGECQNDHTKDPKLRDMSLKKRLKFIKSPLGFNLHNTLLFQRRCFPFRLPFVWIMSWIKILFPRIGFKIYFLLRK